MKALRNGMKAKKRAVKPEPLLSAVARKLGHAAGRLTHATQDLTGKVSALPKNAAAKVREAATGGDPAKRSRARTLDPAKRISPAPRTTSTKVAAAVGKKQKPFKAKSSRRRPAA